MSVYKNIKYFDNKKVDASIINDDQISFLITYLLDAIDNGIDGDIVELGCYVGESSKYLQKTIQETNSSKKLYVYDSFEGLPELGQFEKNTGWTEGGLRSTEDILIKNFTDNFFYFIL